MAPNAQPGSARGLCVRGGSPQNRASVCEAGTCISNLRSEHIFTQSKESCATLLDMCSTIPECSMAVVPFVSGFPQQYSEYGNWSSRSSEVPDSSHLRARDVDGDDLTALPTGLPAGGLPVPRPPLIKTSLEKAKDKDFYSGSSGTEDSSSDSSDSEDEGPRPKQSRKPWAWEKTPTTEAQSGSEPRGRPWERTSSEDTGN